MKILVAFAFVLFANFTLGEFTGKCDLKWELPSGPKSCYKFQNHEKMDWSKAEKACKNAGMHLIALETEAELELIALHLAKGVNACIVYSLAPYTFIITL
jgi:hypothetical protein